jgi:hypothetical protein
MKSIRQRRIFDNGGVDATLASALSPAAEAVMAYWGDSMKPVNIRVLSPRRAT